MLSFLKRYTLPLSMLLGIVGYPVFRHLDPLMPTLIFLMLFFTFCKVNPLDLRLHLWHWLILALQIALTIGAYLLLNPLDDLLAQGLMLCFLMPTAAAAPIIAGRLGGSIQSLTSFTILSNIATVIIVPLIFPLVNPAADMTFLSASWLILKKVGILLLGPFMLAWLIRIVYDLWQRHEGSQKNFSLPRQLASAPFYIWAFTLIVLMADITYSLIHDDYNIYIAIGLALGALVATVVQFFLGKIIGEHFPSKPHGDDYHDILVEGAKETTDIRLITRISAGQAFGQKNTTLGMWLASAYLNPVAALAPAAYIIWQNAFNSIQLARALKGKKV